MKKTIQKVLQRGIPNKALVAMLNKFIYSPLIKKFEKETPVFNTVLFEARTRCNGTCPFCPASIGNDTRDDVTISEELHKKVINDLKAINFRGRITYHINNEPLLVPNLINLISYTNQILPQAWIQILSNGKLLTTKKAEELLAAGINELSINFYNDNFQLKMPLNIREVYEVAIPKFYKPHQIKPGFGPTGDGSKIFRFNFIRRKANEILTNRAGTAPNKKELAKIPLGFCNYPFTTFNITADGRVAKCCSDFYFSDIMGNLNEQSVMDIWHGEKFNRVRKLLLQGKRDKLAVCNKCDFLGAKSAETKLGKLIYFILH